MQFPPKKKHWFLYQADQQVWNDRDKAFSYAVKISAIFIYAFKQQWEVTSLCVLSGKIQVSCSD